MARASGGPLGRGRIRSGLLLGHAGRREGQRVVGEHTGDQQAFAVEETGHRASTVVPGRTAGRVASASVDRADAYSTFSGAVAEVLDIDPSEVRPEARWREDLDADSLAVVEITLALNEAFDIKLPDVEPEQLSTVGQAFELVAGIVGIDE